MNSRELRSLEEGRLTAQLYVTADRVREVDGLGGTACLIEAAADEIIRLRSKLSSSREAAAPPPTPKGLERWRAFEIINEVLGERHSEFSGGAMEIALEAIRRSVEEALVAAASPLEGEKALP